MHPMDALIREWTSVSRHDQRIDQNALLLRFLGTWLYSQYQPFPEGPPFWDRLFRWLDHIPPDPKPKGKGKRSTKVNRRDDQQALFNFVPSLLFVAEEDLIATYRAAYTGPICRWLLKSAAIALNAPDVDDMLADARQATWFGSLAGMDINTFCRVNGIVGQSYRPEFRFLAQFCDMPMLSNWLKQKTYKRIVIVEDIIGTGQQLREAQSALVALQDFEILLVPLFIAPEGYEVAKELATQKDYQHVCCEPIFVLPHQCLVKRDSSTEDSREIAGFRAVNQRRNIGRLGLGGKYGTLVLTHANCPDNVPPIIHQRTAARPVPLFRRASRE